jgi:hypothetical protein
LNATALNVRLTVPLVDLGVTTAGNAGGGLFGASQVAGLVKPNPRRVEAGTVLALQKAVPIAGLSVTAQPDKRSLDVSIFGRNSARGSGLLGALLLAGPR